MVRAQSPIVSGHYSRWSVQTTSDSSCNRLLKMTKDIQLCSITENIDTSSLNGQMVFHIFGAIAEFERGLISDRTKAGLQAARARGSHGGRARLITSTQEEKLKLLIKDPKFSPKELQEMFGISKTTLYRYAQLNKESEKL